MGVFHEKRCKKNLSNFKNAYSEKKIDSIFSPRYLNKTNQTNPIQSNQIQLSILKVNYNRLLTNSNPKQDKTICN